MLSKLITVFCVFFLVACGTAPTVSNISNQKPISPIKTIALSSSGGMLADAIGVELSNRGFSVFDGQSTNALAARIGMDEFEMSRPEGMFKLKQRGIDAYISVKSSSGYDGRPDSASVRVNETETGKVIAGVIWQNGHNGMRGSMADSGARSGLVDTAAQITDSIVKNLR